MRIQTETGNDFAARCAKKCSSGINPGTATMRQPVNGRKPIVDCIEARDGALVGADRSQARRDFGRAVAVQQRALSRVQRSPDLVLAVAVVIPALLDGVVGRGVLVGAAQFQLPARGR